MRILFSFPEPMSFTFFFSNSSSLIFLNIVKLLLPITQNIKTMADKEEKMKFEDEVS